MPILGWIAGLLVRKGLSQARAEKMAPWAGGAAAIALAALLAGLWLHFHDRGVVQRHEAKAVAKVAPAHADAAEQRAKDLVKQAEDERNAHAAIKSSGPDTVPAPAAVAHNCQRLRRAGFSEVSLPAACRLGSGDGTEAKAQR